MFRSGTSLTANLVHDLGAHVLHSGISDHQNERGYWEDQEVYRINELILRKTGYNPLLGTLPTPEWFRERSVRLLRPAGARLVGAWEATPRWVSKDPQFCLTLPFWLPLLRSDPQFILCVRNPLAVLESERGRNTLPPRALAREWFQFTASALRSTRGRRRFVVHYEDYFGPDQGRGQIEALANFLGYGSGPRAADTVRPELQHHEFTLDGAVESEFLSADAKVLYFGLVGMRNDPAGVDQLSKVLDSAARDRARTQNRRSSRLGAMVNEVLARTSGVPPSLRRRVAEALGQVVRA
jgi:hypothetical protein